MKNQFKYLIYVLTHKWYMCNIWVLGLYKILNCGRLKLDDLQEAFEDGITESDDTPVFF